jgi:hypothetical protein
VAPTWSQRRQLDRPAPSKSPCRRRLSPSARARARAHRWHHHGRTDGRTDGQDERWGPRWLKPPIDLGICRFRAWLAAHNRAVCVWVHPERTKCILCGRMISVTHRPGSRPLRLAPLTFIIVPHINERAALRWCPRPPLTHTSTAGAASSAESISPRPPLFVWAPMNAARVASRRRAAWRALACLAHAPDSRLGDCDGGPADKPLVVGVQRDARPFCMRPP